MVLVNRMSSADMEADFDEQDLEDDYENDMCLPEVEVEVSC